MDKIITTDNFDKTKLRFSADKSSVYTNDTYHFKKIYPKYEYSKGVLDDIYIQIPEVKSYGLKTFCNNGEKPSHSFSFCINIKPNFEEGVDEKQAAHIQATIISIFTEIEDGIKLFLKQTDTKKQLGTNTDKNWDIMVNRIKSGLNYQDDKDTGEQVGTPTIFSKLKLKTSLRKDEIITVFSVYDSKSDTVKDIPSHRVVEELQNKRCVATGVIQLESVFVPKTHMMSLQYKLDEALITAFEENERRLVFPSRLKNKTATDYEDADADAEEVIDVVTWEGARLP